MATVTELREQAKTAGVSGYSSMNKADLEKALAAAPPADTGANGGDTSGTTTTGDAPADKPQGLEKAGGDLGSDQVQAKIDAENEKGYRGSVPDETPNEHYTAPDPHTNPVGQ